jgi:fluoroquinolone transport system ATP-binding protein
VDGTIAALDAPRSLRIAHGRRLVRLEMMRDGTRAAREFALETLADDRDFLAELRTGGIETIHTLETTLEDVFVQVTGRTLA